MKKRELYKLVLDLKLQDCALSDIGIYPQAITGGNNPYKERSDYQNGWNAAVMEMYEKASSFSDFVENIPENIREIFTELLIEDVIYLEKADEEIIMCVLMNDIFAWACADQEDITLEDIPLIYQLNKEYGYAGVIAWVSKKRGYEPQEAFDRTNNYLEAQEKVGRM